MSEFKCDFNQFDQLKTKKSKQEYIRNIINNIGLCESVKNKINPKYYEITIINNDGTKDGISWHYCLDKKKRDEFKVACRVAIVDQILEFKINSNLQCCLCNISEVKFHVDHIVHFEKLLQDFLSANKLKVPSSFDDYHDGRACFKNEDKEFEKNWQEYHAKYAQLRILCETCNLSREKFKS